jgi:hypothetical protein
VVFNYAALAPSDAEYETLRAELSKLLGAKIDAKPADGGRGSAMGGGGRPEGRPPREGGEPASRRAGETKPPASRPAPP